MKAFARASVLVLFAALCFSYARGQEMRPDGPPGGSRTGQGGQGMAAAFADHGVQGTVTAISGNDITVKTEDGLSYKIETGVNTRFRKQRDQIKLADIHVGDVVGAFGDKDDKAKTLGAIAVMVFDKEQYEKAKADFGKTWTAGTVQSIDETRIKIKRPDNVIQTVAVDENTSFRKRRDSITLADIKVGDNITARGALQGGDFLATLLSVGGPGGFRGGQRPSGGPNGSASAPPSSANNPNSPNP
jgi:Cu/Ag efflux protein CusF